MKLNRGWWVVFVAAPAMVLGGPSVAHAQESFSADWLAQFHLRPDQVPYRDDRGRIIVDNCPDHHDGRPRCYSHTILQPDATESSGLTATQIPEAYGVPSAAKSGGAIIAIVDVGGYSTALADVQAYRKAYGLPAMTECSGLPKTGGSPCLAIVDETGGPALTKSAGWEGEMALDMDMISAGCPDCSIVMVEATNNTSSNSDFDAAVDYAATIPGVVAVSNSYGWPEAGVPQFHFTTSDAPHYDHPGVLIAAASGDDEYYDQEEGGKGPSFPASAPGVLAVGGTILSTASNSRGWNDVVWNAKNGSETLGTGSGCSLNFAQPSYQSSLSLGTCKLKATNDLSAAADSTVSTGGIMEYEGGKWGAELGTSAASPMTAAILTRLKLAATIGANLGWVYTHASDFNDVTSGTNDPKGECTDTILCTAGTGWDGPSGVGTPDGTKLTSSSGSSSGGSSGSSSGTSSSGSSGSSSGGKSGSSSGTGSSGSSGSSSGSSSGGKSGSSSGGDSSSSSGGGKKGGSSSGSSGSSSSSSSSGGLGEDDAGAQVDGSVSPAGNDAGSVNDDVPGAASSSGCGCFVAPSGSSQTSGVLALGGLALVLSARRRRR